MNLMDLIANQPLILCVIVPTALGIVVFAAAFVASKLRSKQPFWVFLADLDESYPIKPNSRLVYHKLVHMSDLHDGAQERLKAVTEDLKQIKTKLETLAMESTPAPEQIIEVNEDLAGVLSGLEREESNVHPFRKIRA